jgi:hypothetical protein
MKQLLIGNATLFAFIPERKNVKMAFHFSALVTAPSVTSGDAAS